MSKKHTFFILLVSVLYVIYHLVTLSYSPLPWFDEVSFASVTNSYIKHHTFYPEAINITVHRQNTMYGPIYFAIQAFIIKTFGLSMFNFRISNLLFGFADIYLVYRICLQLKFKPAAILATILILAFDRSYNQFLHSGRMDFVTIFFFLASYLVFIEIGTKAGMKQVVQAVLTGTLIACAFLTTPRIVFAFSFYFFYFFYDLYENRQGNLKPVLLKYAIIILTFCALFYLWVYVEFGNIQNYIYATYTSNEVMQKHVGTTLNELRFNSGLLYFVYVFVCFAMLIIARRAKENMNLILLTVPACICFLLLVGGALTGRYYAMAAPFATLLIVGTTMNIFGSTTFKIVNYGIVSILICMFLFKGIYVFTTMQERDPEANEKRIMQYIPAYSTVAGDFEFYYFARRKQCYYQCLGENGAPQTIYKYFLDRKYDYFIFNKNSRDIEDYKNFVFGNRYKLIATIDDSQQHKWMWNIISKLGYMVTENYSCYIYKNISKDSAITTPVVINQ